MDHKFISKLCESYIIDRNLSDKTNVFEIERIHDFLKTDVINQVAFLREDDLEIYNKLYDNSKFNQQQIIYNYLDLCFAEKSTQLSENQDDTEVIQEIDLLSGAIYLLGFGIALQFHSKMTKGIAKVIDTISRTTETIGKFIVETSRSFKLRYSILYRNAEDCYKKAGVNPNDLKALVYMNLGNHPLSAVIGTKRSYEIADTLQFCYLEFSIASLNLLFESYSICLSRTGQFTQVGSLDSDNLLKVISGVKLSPACSDYYTHIKEGIDNFYSLLDFVFDEDEVQKSEYLEKLKVALIKTRDKSKFGGGNKPPYTGGGNKPPYTGGGNKPPYTGGGNKPPYTGGGNKPPYTGGQSGGNDRPPYYKK